MRVRQLEGLLARSGATAAKLDAITRQLRNIGRLPVAGRGPNAPAVTCAQAAAILIALAGSGKGSEAAERLDKLERLRSTENAGLTLHDAIENMLESPDSFSDIVEVRISRTLRRAAIICEDGAVTHFRPRNSADHVERFHVEGVLPNKLLEDVSRAIGGGFASTQSSVSRSRR
jgi:hypothetical protein